MGDIDDIREADLRNGEPDATSWSETDEAAVPGDGATEMRGEHPIPADEMDLDRHPSPGEMPSDTDVQAERQP